MYLELVAATVCLVIVVWSNHVAVAPVRTPRAALGIAAKSLKDVLLLLGAVVLASLVLAVLAPSGHCSTDRAKAAEVHLVGSILRDDIGKNALARRTLVGAGRGVVFQPAGHAKWGLVTNEGQIVVAGDAPPVVFTFTPALVDGNVTWTCSGFPAKFVPKSCVGSDPQRQQ